MAYKKIIGLLGQNIDYSLSPILHNTAAEVLGLNYFYTIFDVQSPEMIPAAIDGIRALGITGVNVTIPYKERVVKHLDSLSAEASEVQAVNTILNQDGYLIGYNTDIYGFTEPLRAYKEELTNHSVVIFGSGGAARAVIQALRTEFKPSQIYLLVRNESKGNTLKDELESRSKNIKITVQNVADDESIRLIQNSKLIINATPIGTNRAETSTASPKDDILIPNDVNVWNSNHIAFDLVYKPQITPFLDDAKKNGARVISGLEMLIHQGSKAFEIWTNHKMPIEKVREALSKELAAQS
jgi:shikimate dehydrogenase